MSSLGQARGHIMTSSAFEALARSMLGVTKTFAKGASVGRRARELPFVVTNTARGYITTTAGLTIRRMTGVTLGVSSLAHRD